MHSWLRVEATVDEHGDAMEQSAPKSDDASRSCQDDQRLNLDPNTLFVPHKSVWVEVGFDWTRQSQGAATRGPEPIDVSCAPRSRPMRRKIVA